MIETNTIWEIVIDRSNEIVQGRKNPTFPNPKSIEKFKIIIKIYKKDCEWNWTYLNDPVLLLDFKKFEKKKN